MLLNFEWWSPSLNEENLAKIHSNGMKYLARTNEAHVCCVLANKEGKENSLIVIMLLTAYERDRKKHKESSLKREIETHYTLLDVPNASKIRKKKTNATKYPTRE